MNYDSMTLGRYPARSIKTDVPPSSLSLVGDVFYWDGAGMERLPLKQFEGPITNISNWTYQGGRPMFRDIGNSERGYAEAYLACEWAKRAIDIRVQKTSELLRMAKVVDANGKEIPNHPFIKSVEMTFKKWRVDLWEDWTLSKYLYGEAYIEIVNAYLDPAIRETGFPVALKPINALAIEPLENYGEIVGYRYDNGYQSKPLALEDVAFDKFRNPLQDNRGYSLIAAALNAINVDRSLVLITGNYLKNNARPGIIFSPKNTGMQPSDQMRIEQSLKDKTYGAANAGRPLFMTIPMDITQVAPPAFSEQQVLSEQQKERICAAIGVPLQMVTSNDMRFQMSQEHRKGFYMETLIPDATKIERVVNTQIMPLFGDDGAKLYVDYEKVLQSMEDPQIRNNIITSQWQSGRITLNQSLQAQGLPVVNGGDFYIMPTNIKVIQQTDLAKIDEVMTPPPPPAPFMLPHPAVTQPESLQAGNQKPPTDAAQPAQDAANTDAGQVKATHVHEHEESPVNADLIKWQTVAVKRLKEGKLAKALEFTSDAIRPSMLAAIKGSLEDVTDVSEVKRVFSHALEWAAYP